MKLAQKSLTVLVCAAVVCLAGCGGSIEKKLIGKWEMDMEEVKEAAQAEAGDNPMAAMAMAMLDNAKVTIEFKEDNVATFGTSMGGFDRTVDGKWEVVKSSGNTATIKIETTNPQTDETSVEEGTLTFVDNDTIEMEPPESANMQVEKVTFNRVK